MVEKYSYRLTIWIEETSVSSMLRYSYKVKVTMPSRYAMKPLVLSDDVRRKKK